MMDFRDNLQKCQEYVQALEEERGKIQVFQRELPLCLDLVTQAIEACKQQLCGGAATTECYNGHSECSEETSSHDDGPVLEEFIPLKRSNSSDDDEELESDKAHSHDDEDNNNNNNSNISDKSGKKSDWLRSVQLWNQTPDPTTTQEEHQPKRVSVVEVKKNGGAFQPFQKEKSSSNVNKPTSVPASSSCSSAQTGAGAEAGTGSGGSGSGKKEEKGSSQRKARRCWSPELHKRFLHALQQLGGSHAATPKQIRELMKVDGLTNDEVKSHLQKYRLHTRRPSSSIHNNPNSSQAPQFVVVGGIWMPPEYAAVAAATTTSGDTNTASAPNGVYAPVAAVATPSSHPQSSKVVTPRQQNNQSSLSHHDERGSHSEGGVHSNSPATSSSTHTTTASHAY